MRLALLADPAVRSALSLEFGRTIEYHGSLTSTQDRARELADTGAPPALVVADEQTAGRGTHGRSWFAPPGTSLLASWLFRPIPADAALFVLLSGVAIARTLERFGIAETRLKWPNDVEIDRRKVAGALAHATTDGSLGALVLGIGVNVHQRAEAFPFELRETAGSLAMAGHVVDRLALLGALNRELDRVAAPAERVAAMAEWRRRASLLGKPVEVIREGRAPLRGVARDVADDGALLVDSERVLAGEVRLVP